MIAHYDEASALADPYVRPLRGFPYKLPDAPGVYRLLQDQQHQVVINATVGVPTIDIQSEIMDAAGAYAVAGTVVPDEHFFFTEVIIYVTAASSIFVDLESRTVHASDGTNILYGQTYGQFRVGTPYRHKVDVPIGPYGATASSPAVCFDIGIQVPGGGMLTITIMYSANPQIRNGVAVKQHNPMGACTWEGILADQCRPKFWTLGDIRDTTVLSRHLKSKRPTTNTQLTREHLQYVTKRVS